MDTRYRIVFSGQIKEGYDLGLVKKVAALRLKASPEQVERLFSGRKAIIKKNLSARSAEKYTAELNHLGLVVKTEVESAPGPIAATPAPAAEPASAAVIAEAEKEAAAEPAFDPASTHLNARTMTGFAEVTQFVEDAGFDPHRTHINLSQAEALLNKAGLTLGADGSAVEQDSGFDGGTATDLDLGPQSAWQETLSPVPVMAQPRPMVRVEPPPAARSAPAGASTPGTIAQAAHTASGDSAFCCPHCGAEIGPLVLKTPAPQTRQVFAASPTERPVPRKTVLQAALGWLRGRNRAETRLN